MSKLTTHQWRLYDFIKLHTELGVSELKVKDIVDAFPNEYYLKERDGNYSNCPQLYKDIDTLNASYEIDKIIIKNNNNFKVANEEEAKAYYNKNMTRAINYFMKAHQVRWKMNKDNQGKLLSNQLRPIDDESKAREFIEAFMGGEYL